MFKMKPAQKEKVKQFINLTHTSEQTAFLCLSTHGWKLDVATDSYYSNPTKYVDNQAIGSSSRQSNSSAERKKAESLFNKYKDIAEGDKKITSDGVIRLLDDLNLNPEDIRVLILAFKCKAEVQCEFTKDEFINGMLEMNADNINTLATRLMNLEKEIKNDNKKLKELYYFTFNYAKNQGQKTVDLDSAIEYWKILLNNKYKHLELWFQYLRECHKRPINKDCWNLLFDFIHLINEDMSNFDCDGAWPSIIDGYVEWFKKNEISK